MDKKSKNSKTGKSKKDINIQPLGDRVLLRPFSAEELTKTVSPK
jgi:hypothetical protein